MEVIALGTSMRYRLGTVATVATYTFRIPARLIKQGQMLRFLAVPLGSGRPQPIGLAEVGPGDRVELTIETRPGVRAER